ncbi:amyloid fiber anchoring/assembly protein TapA [Rossellomorea oryzaecorticis]|uniref:Amyloid fiber anchoring/assembly protein TapA n=1 Tax=Rossellomorea oryzaecorticis TaxID=1396505 RepID=A0ABU9K6V0_9BACI
MKKFKSRYRSFLVAFQILTIWYFMMISALQLNSFTNAAFNDVEEQDASLHVSWYIDDWDKSSLSFDGMQKGGQCGKIFADISRGENKIIFSTWVYEVFKVSKSKTPIGEAIDSGVISKNEINQSDRTARLVSEKITENGKYQFRVKRPLGHPGDNQPDEQGYSYMWNEGVIEVKDCVEPLATPKEERKQESSEDTSNNKDETISPSETETKEERIPITPDTETTEEQEAPAQEPPSSEVESEGQDNADDDKKDEEVEPPVEPDPETEEEQTSSTSPTEPSTKDGGKEE